MENKGRLRHRDSKEETVTTTAGRAPAEGGGREKRIRRDSTVHQSTITTMKLSITTGPPRGKGPVQLVSENPYEGSSDSLRFVTKQQTRGTERAT